MIEKYTENPTYGPTKKLEAELKAANQKLKHLESELTGLRSYHENLINYKGNDTLRVVGDVQLLTSPSPSLVTAGPV